MMYFLDFDRTVFDTDSFIAYLSTHPVAGPIYAEVEGNRTLLAHTLMADPSFNFSPGELSQFMYEDAARFLRDKENGVMLITYGEKEYQKAKVESAIFGIPRISTIYTGEVRKGDFMAPHIGMYGASPVFVDDSPLELEIISARCPGALVYEMRRDGGLGDGRWPVLSNLSELI